MKTTYDKIADAKYIKVSEKTSRRGVVTRTECLSDWLNVDYDKQGNVYGIEVLNASRHPVAVLVDQGSVVVRVDLPRKQTRSSIEAGRIPIAV
jgi:uncharacterized protein YuzE